MNGDEVHRNEKGKEVLKVLNHKIFKVNEGKRAMVFNYYYTNKEANFGNPIKQQVKNGAHLTFEIVPVYRDKMIALFRDSVPGHEKPPGAEKHPKGMFYFCHDLIRFAEPMDDFVQRIVKTQTGVNVIRWKITDFESTFQRKDNQWALVGYILAEVDTLPKHGFHGGNDVKRVVAFAAGGVPEPFGWWSTKDVKAYAKKHLK